MAIRCLTALVLAIVLAVPASAAKWEGGCPAVKYKLSRVGHRISGGTPLSLSRYFWHVGHAVTLELSASDVLRFGGFSTDPDGNTLEVTFTPWEAAPIPLPPIPVTATSPAALTIVIPDSRPVLGRLLVGPARLVVKRGTTELFEITKHLILPPMNDVRAIATQGYEAELLAALDARRGKVWIPLGFSGFGGDGESLPECPTVLTPVTAFAVDLSLKKDDDQAFPYVSFGFLRKNLLFLGDYVVIDKNYYGSRLKTKLDVKPLGGHGIAMCALNDAIQLVVMFGLRNPAFGKRSVLLPLVADGSPAVVKVENISADEHVAPLLERLRYDAVSSSCYPEP